MSDSSNRRSLIHSTLILALAAFGSTSGMSPLLAQSSDGAALNSVFGEADLADNFPEFLKDIGQLPPEARWKSLADWVLPNEEHGFRIQAAFDYAAGQPEAAGCESLVSPVLELVKATHTDEQLAELQERLARAKTSSLYERRCQQSVLCLVALANANADQARVEIDRLLSMSVDDDLATPDSRWPDVLVAWEGIEHPELKVLLSDYFTGVYLNLTGFQVNSELDVQEDYLRALSMRRQRAPLQDALASPEWLPSQFMDSSTHGLRRPISEWKVDQGQGRKVSGHETDYLLYALPLRGNYAIECDLSQGIGLQAGLQVGGNFVETVDGGARLLRGSFRKQEHFSPLQPSLVTEDKVVHHRVEFQDGVMSHFVSGRLVLQEPIHPDCSPWVGVRSWRRAMVFASDVRITGKPVVPASINLSADPALSSWAPYYEWGFGTGQGNWSAMEEPTGTEIHGRMRTEIAGCRLEKLLRYQRPVWEDGRIEYEFYYEPEKVLTHPCIGHTALLLSNDGVRVHRLTDRINETSDLDPGNAELLGNSQVPLHPKEWNKLALTFKGDQVQCFVNGQLVSEYTFPPSIERTFGLFHYADQTAARVRNVIWHGGWARDVPDVSHQILASQFVAELDQDRSKLKASYYHSFAEGLPRDLFTVSGNENSMQQLPEGLQVTRSNQQGVEEIRSCLGLKGDYDIILGFQDLQIENQGEDRNGIGLQAWLANFTDDNSAVYRREEEKRHLRRTTFAHKSRQPDGSLSLTMTHLGEESDSGRLRLVRRGDTVFALMSEADSPNYRLVGQHPVASADVLPDGVRLLSFASPGQTCVVTWTYLDIRAEQTFNAPIQDSLQIVKTLDSARTQLTLQEVDFRREDDGSNLFQFSSTAGVESSLNAAGLLVDIPGTQPYARSDIRLQSMPLADFDTSVAMDVLRLESDNDSQKWNEVALQCRLTNYVGNGLPPIPDNENPVLEAALILRQKQPGVRLLIARTVEGQRGQGLNYRVLRALPVKSPDMLRIALHDHTLYYLYSEAGSDEEVVLATRSVDERTIGAGPALMTTADAGYPTTVVWKSLRQYARVLDLSAAGEQ